LCTTLYRLLFLITDYYSMNLVYAVIFDVVLCRPIIFVLYKILGLPFLLKWRGMGLVLGMLEPVTVNIFSVNQIQHALIIYFRVLLLHRMWYPQY